MLGYLIVMLGYSILNQPTIFTQVPKAIANLDDSKKTQIIQEKSELKRLSINKIALKRASESGILTIKENTVFKQSPQPQSALQGNDKTPLIRKGATFQFESIEIKNYGENNPFNKHLHLEVHFSSAVKSINGNPIKTWWVYADHVSVIK